MRVYIINTGIRRGLLGVEMMNLLALAQIEADVVITLNNADMGTGRVLPQWECTMTADELTVFAMQQALRFAEHCGGGIVDFQIFDFRIPAV